jgi:hypothetical protein
VIFRIYPIRDTFITNDIRSNVRKTGSNLGQSEELVVFKKAAISGVFGTYATASLARTLVQFDFSAFSALTASGQFPTASLSYHLRLNHKTSAESLPYSYNMLISPVSSSWDEGRGMDVELGDAGVANWIKRTQQSFWTQEGGDFLLAPSCSVHFDTGYEDIDVDVTALVGAWLTGGLANNGLGIRMSGAIESNSDFTDYFTKKFYSRQSDFADRRPYIEARSRDFRTDDRKNMQWARTGSLFLYNVIGGVLQDLTGQVVMSIADASGVLAHVTASRMVEGVYSASFALPTGSYSGSLFYDRWRAGAVTLTTGSFVFNPSAVTNTLTQFPLVASMRNLQVEYLPEDVVDFEVFFRRKPHTSQVLSTASFGVPPYIVETAFYAIENDATRERVVPFGTGSQQHTRLSYGGNGNSFRFHMSSLHSGNVYRIVLLVDEQGRRQIIDPGFRFKVV